MPAKSEKQRRFMGAELARKREGKKTRTNMSEAKLGEFASKSKVEVSKMNHQDFASQLDKHINHLEKRHTYTHEEAREVFDRDAAKVISERQRKRDAELRRERGLPSNNLEKRHRKGMSHTEAREFFDRDAAKVMSGRQRERDAELRRERGLPEPPVTHVDRSVKFRDLETKQGDDDISQNAEYQAAIASNKAEADVQRAEENTDIARRGAYSRRNRVQDAELFGTEDEYQTALASVTDKDKKLMESGYPSKTRNIDQPLAVAKSKIVDNKYLLPAQDSNGNMIPNDTIPYPHNSYHFP